jgi:hypothetical protein
MAPNAALRALFAVGASCLLVGCSLVPISDVPPAGAQSAEVFVVREKLFRGGFNSQYLSVDGVTIARLDSGEYTKFRVSEGTHVLQIRWSILLHGQYVRTARFDAKTGENYLFVTWFQRGTPKAEGGADWDYSETMGIQLWDWAEFARKVEGKTFVAPGR